MSETSPAGGQIPGDNRRRAVVAGGVAALLLVLAVAASRPPTIAVGGGEANAGPLVAVMHTVEVVGLALEAALLVLLVVLLWPQRRPKDDEEPKPQARPVPWWLRLVIFLMPLVMLGTLIWTVLHLRPGMTQPGESPLVGIAPTTSDETSAFGGTLGLAGWEVLLALLLAAAMVAAVLRQLFWLPRRELVEDAPKPSREAEALAAAVAASLSDAREETDPRRAVIAAYATMERVLAERDLPRRESEATLEYMERLFGALPTGREAVATLTRLFEVARFSQHEVPPAAKRQAIDALVRLRDALGGTA